jgi:DNA helicase II / ATP-dependent DNA helicase PcrA
MTWELCKKRQQILDERGHVLVTGGPGSGKTTIALLKALHRIEESIEEGQAILFLSFSRAAVARIAEAAREQIPRANQSLLNIQTFHSFFWEILRTHAYLLGAPKKLTLLSPHDERALSDGITRSDTDPAWQAWMTERERLFQEEGRTAFDLFAPKTAEILAQCARIRRVVAVRYPLIIVDEAQDTGPDQWACIKALAKHSQLLCLADLEQQIFDFLPGIGPERIIQIEGDLTPVRIDLGAENHRSPDNEIAAFGADILAGKARTGAYSGVSQLQFHPKAERRDHTIRQSVGVVYKLVKAKIGQPPESIAILASFDRGATIVSNALRGGNKPIPHKVLFDESSTLLSSRLVAFLLEPKVEGKEASDLAEALELLSCVFRAKGSATALKRARELEGWAYKTRIGNIASKAGLYKHLAALVRSLGSTSLTGDPRKDWSLLRGMLRDTSVKELVSVDRDLEYLVAFNRGKRIASNLSSLWEEHGQYVGARRALDAALAEDQILSGVEELSGIHVMTMHKPKGKQFDAVIIFQCDHSSPLVWRNDPAPYRRSRKILRVAITRARIHTLILRQAFPACPILAQYNL